MTRIRIRRRSRAQLACASGLAVGLALAVGMAQAAPSAAPGYTLSTFATAPTGSSAPDSIAVVGSNVFIGYGNGGDPTGANGAMSTIVEYTSGGTFLGSLTLTGHNDGLRYDAATGQLWAIQNEDANPNLILINPTTRTASAPLPFSATPHGGGYDDVAFGPNGTYVSASNPANNPNTGPAIVSASVGPSVVTVGNDLMGDATATVINPSGGTTALNLQDPDSMIFGPGGKLVLDSQADHQLVFVGDVGTTSQSVSVLNLQNEVDDTVFGSGPVQRLLVADTAANTVYELTGHFDGAVSAADTLGQVVSVNLTNGAFTPLASGLQAPHGEAFLSSVPEPSSWGLMLVGVGALGLALRLRRDGRPALTA